MMDRSTRQIFSENVRNYRLAKGLSQEELGDLASLHRNYVGGVERGERNISIDNMERLAQALEIDLVDLLKNYLVQGNVKGGGKRGLKD